MDLRAYMQPPVANETKTVYPSKRLKGADGEPAPFIIRVIDQETNSKLIKRAMEKKKVNGRLIEELNNEKYGNLLVQTCVVEPDLKNADLCSYYKTVNPVDTINRMLSVGEFNRLVREIKKLNEIDELANDEDAEDIEEELKN